MIRECDKEMANWFVGDGTDFVRCNDYDSARRYVATLLNDGVIHEDSIQIYYSSVKIGMSVRRNRIAATDIDLGGDHHAR